jgi:hypothetical protein
MQLTNLRTTKTLTRAAVQVEGALNMLDWLYCYIYSPVLITITSLFLITSSQARSKRVA